MKDAGTTPAVREELIIAVRNGRMSLETAWRSEEGIGSRGQVVAWLALTILLTSSEVRGINWVKTGGDGRRGDGGRDRRGANVLHLLGKVGN